MNFRSAILVASISMAFIGSACAPSVSDVGVTTSPVFSAEPNTNSVTGTVTALSGNCPALTFTVEGHTIKTDASTVFGDGGCGALKNGQRIVVTVSMQSDGGAKATKIAYAATVTPPPLPPVPVPTPVGVVVITGGIRALAGSCPVLSFTLEGKIVKTNAGTAFGDGVCAALRNDVRVAISGAAQTDGSILALKVTVVILPPVTPPVTPPVIPPPVIPPPASRPRTPPPLPPTTVTSISGAITALAGSCPQLVITIGERRAITSAGTVFDGKTCAAFAVGAHVEITGLPTAINAPLLATKVSARP